ncbi:MAG: hypothetical protein V4621_04000 [Pseudomonadota bacterium]
MAGRSEIIEKILDGARPYKRALPKTHDFLTSLAGNDTLVDNAINLVKRDGVTGVNDIKLQARGDLARLWDGFAKAQKADGQPLEKLDDNFRQAFGPAFDGNQSQIDEFYTLTRAAATPTVQARATQASLQAANPPLTLATTGPAPKPRPTPAAAPKVETPQPQRAEAPTNGRNRVEPTMGQAPAAGLTKEQEMRFKVFVQQLDNTGRPGSRMTDADLIEFSEMLEGKGLLQNTGKRDSVNAVIHKLDEGQAISPAELRDLKQYHSKWNKPEAVASQNAFSAAGNWVKQAMSMAVSPISGAGHAINRYSPFAFARNPQALLGGTILTTVGLGLGAAVTDGITGDKDPTTPSISEQTTLKGVAGLFALPAVVPGGQTYAQEYYEQTMRLGPARAHEYLLRVAGLVETTGPDGKKVIQQGPVDPANQDLRSAVQEYISRAAGSNGGGSSSGTDILPTQDIRANTLYFLTRYGATQETRIAAMSEIDRLASGGAAVTPAEQALGKAVKGSIERQTTAQEAITLEAEETIKAAQALSGKAPQVQTSSGAVVDAGVRAEFSDAANKYVSNAIHSGYAMDAPTATILQNTIRDAAVEAYAANNYQVDEKFDRVYGSILRDKFNQTNAPPNIEENLIEYSTQKKPMSAMIKDMSANLY